MKNTLGELKSSLIVAQYAFLGCGWGLVYAGKYREAAAALLVSVAIGIYGVVNFARKELP